MTVRVLVVDDSPTARLALRRGLEADGDVVVVAEAADVSQAIRCLERHEIDLVTMDVVLGGDDGIDATAAIMACRAKPILVVTGTKTTPALVYRALAAGALEVATKLPGPDEPTYADARRTLVRRIKALAAVPVVHRGLRAPMAPPTTASAARAPRVPPTPPLGKSAASGATPFHALAVGASTGGPPVVAALLAGLPRPCPVPVLVVQHMVPSFVPGFGRWLEEVTGFPVAVVGSPATMRAGTVYLPAGDRHLVVAGGRVVALDASPRLYQRPSVDVLFESVASSFAARAIGVLLTGMGSDGANGLLGMRAAGALTVAQEPSSCAVDGMPRAAIERRATVAVRPPEGLAPLVRAWLAGSRAPSTP